VTPRGQRGSVPVRQGLRRTFAFELFLEPLQQAFVDPQHQRGAAVEALHHLLDRKAVGVVDVAQARGQRLLVVEAQAFLALSGGQVQAEPQPRQRPVLAFQGGVFVGAQLPERHQRLQVAGAGHAQRHPAQGLDVAHPARAFLEVRFQVVAGVVETRMPRALFLALGDEVVARRPCQRRRDRRVQGRDGLRIGL